MLSPYTVLDLTDHRGELTAMMLGDMGADVIKVEPLRALPAAGSLPFWKTLPSRSKA